MRREAARTNRFISQALLKRRKRDGDGRTPKTKRDVRQNNRMAEDEPGPVLLAVDV